MIAEIVLGKKYGRWTVIEKASAKNYNTQWLCRCDCGTERVVIAYNLLNGRSKSCGCLKAERMQEQKTKHGHTRRGKMTDGYRSWTSMKSRCSDVNDKHFKDYGGRGIKVCDRWNSFENFYADMGPRPSKNHSIERVDGNGNYDPANCKWATHNEQAKNRRVRSDSGTGVKGVSLDRNKYVVTIGIDGKRHKVGRFDNLEDAAAARLKAEKLYW